MSSRICVELYVLNRIFVQSYVLNRIFVESYICCLVNNFNSACLESKCSGIF